MQPLSPFERTHLIRELGTRDQRIANLEQQLNCLKEGCEPKALEWNRLLRHQCDLAEWLIECATNNRANAENQEIRPRSDHPDDSDASIDEFDDTEIRWGNTPDPMTAEDEEILDRVWDRIAREDRKNDQETGEGK